MPASLKQPQRRVDGRLSGRPDEPPQRVEATRRATLLAALPMVLMLLFLAGQLALLTEQRRLIAGQKELQEVLVARSSPVLDAARPLVEDLSENRDAARAAAARADRLVRESRPLVRETRPLVEEAAPLVQDLRRVGAPGAIRDAGVLARQATEGRRLARALDATLAALAEQQRLGLLADADRAAELTPTIVRLQRQTLAVQRESRDIQRTTLAVQQEALARIRSIDDKTGGPAPGAVASGRRAP